ncbi:ABC transporter ATP-binding protein [Martelella mediterranea]|uniref:Oligopeptide/dipeptide ABC transporter ATP-binding protein n=1 Tax=Martelella mediterranea TaxID=293089 RepID=A0A4R3NU69_9HYPH|nr:ABC transporter ATP-binding protein [Martelella mediterranea]TCT39859.1 oligopeptide/dipeptide ABC transporter ATP-binding protein [Martelella mediterranea]
MTDLTLKIEDLKLGFKSWSGVNPVLHGISLHIRKGERVALVGESGSGKSVTARIVLGMLQELSASRISGNVLFEGEDVNAMRAKRHRALRGTRVSMIFQDPTSSLNPVYTIGRQFFEVLCRADPAISEKDARQKAASALDDVAIHEPERVLDSYAFQLSGGMNQRVMIAMALVNNPALLLADEPGTALDVTVQAQTLKLMSGLVEKHETAVLFISHNLGVVREFADRVYVIYKGNIVEQGPTDALFADPRHPYTKALLSAVPRISGGGIPDIAEDMDGFHDPLIAHEGYSERELLK